MECGWLPATEPHCSSLPGSRPLEICAPVFGSIDRRVDPARGGDLRLRQATGSVAALALERCRDRTGTSTGRR